jgi:macrocin-O-methyltransferase TylF-like protien
MIGRAVRSLRYRVAKHVLKRREPAFGWASHLQAFQREASPREWQQLMFYLEMIGRVSSVPGDVAEFGVASGVSFLSFARCLEILERGFEPKERRKLYGFDSFAGLPELGARDRSPQTKNPEMRQGGFHVPDAYAGLFDYVRQNPQCALHQGWFKETIPRFLAENPHVSFALVHVDCDLYESTREVLERVWEHVSPGGTLVFDELFHPDFPGETLAFREFFQGRLDYALARSQMKPDKKYLVKLPSAGLATPNGAARGGA